MVGDSGVVYVTYIDEQSGSAEYAFVKSFSTGIGWTGYTLIDTLGGFHQYPDMAKGGTENIFVVWEITNTSYLSWSCDEGATWETPVMIDPVETPDEVESPTVYVGPNNFVFVSASHRGGGALPPRHIFSWRWQ